MANAKEWRELVKRINREVYKNAVDMKMVKVRTSEKFIGGHAVGLCEFNHKKGTFILTFSDEVPTEWLKNWPVYACGIAAHELAHVIQVLAGDESMRLDNPEADPHHSKMFRMLRRRFAKKTGIPARYFGNKDGVMPLE